MAKELQQSETVTIHRSEINLNPVNPKRHTDERIKLQRKNLQKVGYLGGIVWNRTSGNLIDGHRRIQAMDLHYKYDGTLETDYEVKVEAVELDDKAEKEQLTYMAIGNTKADISIIADYAADIDISDIGLSDAEINSIMSFADIDVATPVEVETIIPVSASEKKEHVKNIKEQTKAQAIEREREENAYITLSFSSFEAKSAFCDLIGAEPVLRRLVDAGHKLVLFTMRSNKPEVWSFDPNIYTAAGNYLDDAVNWFKKRNIPLWGVNENPEQKNWTDSPKPYCNLYIDDSALGTPLIYNLHKRPFVDWHSVEEMLVKFNIIEANK